MTVHSNRLVHPAGRVAGAGSLAQAITDADPGDTIVFAPGVTGTITLGATLLVDKDLTIHGPGPAQVTIAAEGFTGFAIGAGVTAEIQGFTIVDASNGVQGSGSAAITLRDLVLTGNSFGVALNDVGDLTLGDVTATTNDFGGIQVQEGGAVVANGVTANDNGFTGVQLQKVASAELTDVVANNNGTFGSAGARRGIRVTTIGPADFTRITALGNPSTRSRPRTTPPSWPTRATPPGGRRSRRSPWPAPCRRTRAAATPSRPRR